MVRESFKFEGVLKKLSFIFFTILMFKGFESWQTLHMANSQLALAVQHCSLLILDILLIFRYPQFPHKFAAKPFLLSFYLCLPEFHTVPLDKPSSYIHKIDTVNFLIHLRDL